MSNVLVAAVGTLSKSSCNSTRLSAVADTPDALDEALIAITFEAADEVADTPILVSLILISVEVVNAFALDTPVDTDLSVLISLKPKACTWAIVPVSAL